MRMVSKSIETSLVIARVPFCFCVEQNNDLKQQTKQESISSELGIKNVFYGQNGSPLHPCIWVPLGEFQLQLTDRQGEAQKHLH